jgi:hypothetical protein
MILLANIGGDKIQQYGMNIKPILHKYDDN